jgi:hypothetical protein
LLLYSSFTADPGEMESMFRFAIAALSFPRQGQGTRERIGSEGKDSGNCNSSSLDYCAQLIYHTIIDFIEKIRGKGK